MDQTTRKPAPDPRDLAAAAELARVEGLARRIETPTAAGRLVWREWGGEHAGPDAASGHLAPLVLGHGAQGAWSHWVRNVEALAAGRRVLAVDLPGHGDSDMPAAESHEAIAAMLAEGLRQVLGSEQADVVAFSLSGTLFAWTLALHPGLARRLVLVGCGGLDTPHGHVDLKPSRGLTGEARRAVLRGNLLGLMLHHEASADDLAIHQLVVSARAARLKSAPALVLPDRLLRVLPRVPVPVDAIWGEFDRPHPDPAVQEAALRTVRRLVRFNIVPDAGHWAMYERPEAFGVALKAILEN